MANKRANGEGTIVKNMRNGVQKGWRASITIGRDDKGKIKLLIIIRKLISFHNF